MTTPAKDSRSAVDRFGYTLPIGIYQSGQRISEFELAPVRGSLRRQLLNARHGPEMTITALQHVLKRLGPTESPSKDLIRRLAMPDVDYIHLIVWMQTKGGPKQSLKFTCGNPELDQPGCELEFNAPVDLSKIGVQEGVGELQVTSDGLIYQEVPVVDPTTSVTHTMKVRIPFLADQEILAHRLAAKTKRGRDDDVAFGDFLWAQISHMMLDFDGRGKGLSVEELDEMPGAFCDAIVHAAQERYPIQLDKELEVVCPRCGSVSHRVLPVESWMDPFGSLTRSRS